LASAQKNTQADHSTQIKNDDKPVKGVHAAVLLQIKDLFQKPARTIGNGFNSIYIH